MITLIFFPSLVYVSQASTEEVLRGKCWGTILEGLKCFFDALVAEDMELIFFSDGYQVPKNEPNWLSNKTKRYLEECQVIEDIQKGVDVTKHKGHSKGTAVTVYRDFLEQNLKSYGKWLKIFDKDVNIEMARYAKKHNVYAVFNDEIEFLVYPGHYRLWRVRNIKIDDFTTKEINKFNFRKALGLFPEHMPLFATLCGNDILTDEKLEAFHSSYPEKDRFKSIAKYVSKVQSRDSEVDIEKISKRIGCSKKLLEASLLKYVSKQILFQNQSCFKFIIFQNLDQEVEQKFEEEDEDNLTQILRTNGNSHIYALLKMQPLRLGPYFEDLRYLKLLQILLINFCIHILKHFQTDYQFWNLIRWI